MASASELGASLLADVRQRNDQRAKAARKRAKKNAWKKLGVDVLLGAADNMFEQRQEEFLVNEDNMRDKLNIGTANKNATNIYNTEQAASSYKGGIDAYWTEKAKPMVDDYLSNEYAAGTYNDNEYNKFSKNLASKYGQQLKEVHEKKYLDAKTFLDSTGGGDAIEAFNASLKRQKGKGISGYVTELINKGTGMLGKDSATLSSRMVDNAKTFQKAYDETGDAALSEFISKNKLLENVDLGDPSPTLGTPVKLQNHITGEEYLSIPVIQTKANGSVSVSSINANNDGNTITNSDVNMAEQTFATIVNNAMSKGDSPLVASGMTSLSNLNAEDNKLVIENITQRLDDAGLERSEPYFAKAAEKAKDRYNAIVGTSIYTLQRNGFNPTQSSAIANELLLNSFDSPVNKVLSGAGSSNPWHTLHATHSAVTKKKINIPPTMQSTLITDNSLNLLRAYRSETTAGQEAINKTLADNDYYIQLGVDESLKSAHLAIQKIVTNPQEFAGMSDAQALEAAIK